MSLNRIAASTSYRRNGCRVISVISSGRVHASRIGTPSLTLWYSGSERPAWRMNQTGVYGTGSPRQARMKGDVVWGWVTTGFSHRPRGPRTGASPARRHAARYPPESPSYMPRSGRVSPSPVDAKGTQR